MKKSIFLLFVGLAILVGIQDFYKKKRQHDTPAARPYVILLSIDGFRWDYCDKAYTPTLDSIAKYGVQSYGLQPCFPSLSLTNQYSIATGLYPENHEIISDNFYSNKLKKYFSEKDNTSINNGGFYKGEPIWVTAEAQNIKTGSYSWRGAQAKIKGYKSTYINTFNGTHQHTQNIDTIINWLEKPYKQRPKLITWGVNSIYAAGLNHGTESNGVEESISMVDSLIGYFLNQTSIVDIKDSINLIIVSNHGMSNIDKHKTIALNRIIDKNWVDTILGDNAFLLIQPKKQFKDSVIDKLNNTKGISAWDRDNIPEKFNITKSSRLPDVIAVADSGWSISKNALLDTTLRATCGYNNTTRSMHGIFYAIGPAFKKSYNAGELYNIDIYNLLCRVLAIKPAPNDGNSKRINHVLK